MDIKKLHEEFSSCECGKNHVCDLKHVLIGTGVLEKLPEILNEYKCIYLICDVNTYKACGEKVEDILSAQYLVQNTLVMSNNGDVVIPNEEKISEIENAMLEGTDFILGVGSGVINDLCKYVSHKHGIPYGIVATAPSMDGYASVGSALILEGMKVTLNAKPPIIIVADTDVLKNAPMQMIRAGYGDIVGKYSCLNDWKLSALINGEYFCQKVYDLTFAQAEKVKGLADKIESRDSETAKALMEALVLVGIAMSFVGNSRPASGSEHHLSHFFEITGILENKEYFPHGIDVAFSSIETSKIRDLLLSSTPKNLSFDREKWVSEIKRVYHSSADGVIALQDKLGWYDKNDFDNVLSKWDEIKTILSECPSAEEFTKMLSAVGLNYQDFISLYGEGKIKDATLYAKDLKDRYSVLWLYYSYFREI